MPHLQTSSVTEPTNKMVSGERGKLHQQHPVGFDGQGPVCEVPAFFLNDVVTFILQKSNLCSLLTVCKAGVLEGLWGEVEHLEQSKGCNVHIKGKKQG